MIIKMLRVNIALTFSGMFKGSRSAKKRGVMAKIGIGALAVYCVGAFALGFGTMFMRICEPFYEMELGWLYFAMVGITAFALCFIGSVFMASSQLFRAKDNELLLAMPIKPSAIMAGRMGTLILMSYVYEVIVAVPAGVVWCVSAKVTAAGAVGYVLALLFLPLMTMALACLFGWLIAEASARMQNAKLLSTALTLILSLAFLFAYFWFYSRAFEYIQVLVENGAAVADAVRRALPPAYFFGAAASQGDMGALALFLLCCVVPFIIAYLLVAANFARITTTNRGGAREKYREKRLRASGTLSALTRKELRHFTSSAMYMMNAALGAVFTIAIGVLLLVKREEVLGMFIGEDTAAGMAFAIVCGGLCLCGVMNLISAPSISLEGKNLWIARSIPVRTRDILMSKVYCHLIICLPASVLASILCCFALKVTAVQALLMLLVPALGAVFVALLGVFMNLQFPKLDWVSEVVAVKQGIASMLTMFGSMMLVLLLGVLYAFVLKAFVGIELYLALCGLIFAVLCAALYAYLRKRGCAKFEEL